MPRLRSNYGIIGTTQTLIAGSVRGGMFSGTDQYNLIRSNTWPYGGTTDVNLKYTPFLLSARNYDPNTSYFYKDASTNNFALTLNGDTRAMNFSPFNTTWSNYFNGSSAVVFTSGSQFNTGTGAYTLEGWVNFTTAPNNTYLFGCLATNGLCFYYSGTGTLTLYQYGVGAKMSATFTPTLGVWYHFAAARANDGTCVIWINGVSYGRSTDTTNYSLAAFSVGGISGGFVTGYISNVRLTFNDMYGVFNTSIVVPTQNLTTGDFCSILTCQSNRFVDNSVYNNSSTLTSAPTVVGFGPFTENDLTTGSTYFDGTGDYLSVANNAALNVGSGNFCIEAWFNVATTASQQSIVSNAGASGSDNTQIDIVSGNIRFTSSATLWLTGGAVTTNTWNHVAVCRSGTTLSLFLNGVRQATATNSTNFANANNYSFFVASLPGASVVSTGYISNVRVVKGSTPYDPTLTTLTVPTAPLTAITNTQLLTLQSRQNMNNNVFLDSSPTKSLITRFGNTNQGTFTPFSQTGWSNYFSGSGSYTNSTGTLISTTTTTFTIECWIYPTVAAVSGTSIPSIIGDMQPTSTNNYWSFGTLASGAVGLYWYDGASKSAATTGTVSLNQWTHIAISVNANAISMYINGSAQTLTGTTTLTNRTGTNGTFALAQFSNANSLYTGYISNLRMTTTALYTGSFAPPTSPLTAITNTVLLTCQSYRFVDNSTNAYTITPTGTPSIQAFSPFSAPSIYTPTIVGGSGYFDGSGDYLSIPYNPNLLLNGIDSTIEAWVYFNTSSSSWSSGGTPGVQTIIAQGTGAVGGVYSDNWLLIADNTVLNFVTTGATSVSTAIANVPVRQWFHVAVVITAGTSAALYINGVSQASNAISAVGSNTGYGTVIGGNFLTGGGGGNNSYVSGYITNIRIVRGQRLASGNFTPPTAPVTATSIGWTGTNVATSLTGSVVLLTNFTNANLIDYTAANNLETVGDARLSTAVTKFNSASIYFDGTTDCLFQPSNTNYGYGTGDFTIEFWLYLNAVTSQTLVSNLTTTTSTAPHIYYKVSVGLIYYTGVSGTGADRITGSALTAGQWYHVAVCRSSGSTKMFINGTQTGSTYTDANNYGSSNPLGVGDYGAPLSGTLTLNGYIDELRITKAARYTANFAAPTSALPVVGFTPVTTVIPLEYLVVAGGGGGGANGGGGGAGGFRTSTSFNLLTGTVYTVTVGGGGAAVSSGAANPGFDSVFASITSTGGGRGGSPNDTNNAGTGGSGGGGARSSTTATPGAAGNTPATSPSQGNNGGSGQTSSPYPGGGGGGAGAAGGNGSGGTAGVGGAGASSSITGPSVTYAGGGGAGYGAEGVGPSAGGSGGGGAGAGSTGNGTSGTPNTGGGGGAGFSASSGSGGSGVIVIAYLDIYPAPASIGVGLTYTVDNSTRAGYRIYRFTAGTGTIYW